MTLGEGGVIHLPTALRQAIAVHAEACYPREACGLLVGQRCPGGWRVTEWHPAANRHPQPERHFELDPATHIALLRRLRAAGQGLCLLGHLHSHSDAPAAPSPRDLAMAFDPAMLWLIQSVRQGKAAELTAWRILPGPHFASVALEPINLPPT